eukprot:m.478250 g.478250  ORF g.478250 m.478250 type:complete len:260 (+) comp21087_c1_seq1:249-1028(+)
MKRMVGTARKTPKASDDGCQDRPRRADFVLFGMRAAALFAAVVCSALVTSFTDKYLTSDGSCLLSLRGSPSATDGQLDADAPAPVVMDTAADGKYECRAVWHMSLYSAVCAGILFVVCLYNLATRRFRAHASKLAIVQMGVTSFVLAASLAVSAMLWYNFSKLCQSVGHSACAAVLNAQSPGLGKKWLDAETASFVAVTAWGVTLLLTALRYSRARKRELALRAEQEEESRLRREKIAAQEAAKKAEGEGKGFVYRLLM